MDGTLLNDTKQIAQKDLAALNRLRQIGVFTALATGRSNYSFLRLFDQLDHRGQSGNLPFDHIIFSTGAGVMDFPGGRIIKSFALAPDDVCLISRLLDQMALDYMIHHPVPDTRHFLYRCHSRKNHDFNRRLELYRDFAAPLSSAALAEIPGATEVLCIVPQEHGHEIAACLSHMLKQFSVIKATSPLDGQSIWIEIFSPFVSKSQAVRWLAGEIGVSRTEICAVGNDYNDEDLLLWAGRSFVVANSPASIRAHFHAVASNNEGGVSEAATLWLGLD